MRQTTFCYLSLLFMGVILAVEIVLGRLLTSPAMLVILGVVSNVVEMALGFCVILVCIKTMRYDKIMRKVAKTAAQASDERFAGEISNQMIRFEFLNEVYDVVDVDCIYSGGVEKNKVRLLWKLKRNDGRLIYTGSSEEQF